MIQSLTFFADVPLKEGISVFAVGFAGVFAALTVLAVGIKVVSIVVDKLDSKEKSAETGK